MIRRELAALELKAGERLGRHLALTAGLGELDVDDKLLEDSAPLRGGFALPRMGRARNKLRCQRRLLLWLERHLAQLRMADRKADTRAKIMLAGLVVKAGPADEAAPSSSAFWEKPPKPSGQPTANSPAAASAAPATSRFPAPIKVLMTS